jgi:hypothetical protein
MEHGGAFQGRLSRLQDWDRHDFAYQNLACAQNAAQTSPLG